MSSVLILMQVLQNLIVDYVQNDWTTPPKSKVEMLKPVSFFSN
jgi:hypothetical protein